MRAPNLDLMKNKVAIQGNLNPAILLESNEVIKEETYKILDKYKDYPGYIFNLGHGITPNISPDLHTLRRKRTCNVWNYEWFSFTQ